MQKATFFLMLFLVLLQFFALARLDSIQFNLSFKIDELEREVGLNAPSSKGFRSSTNKGFQSFEYQ